MDVDDLVDIADYYSWQNNDEKANEVIDHALSIYPSATLPNVFKARQALMDDQFEEARSYADQIADQDDPDYHYLKAEILIAEGNIELADRYLRDYSMTVDADEYSDYVKDVANLYIDYDVNDKAYEWMLRSRGDNSDDFKELLGRTFFGLGKYDDSERIFNELIDRNPYSKQYWNALASAQYMKEDYSGAITSSEYAIAIDPEDPQSILSKASGLFHLGNYEEAYNYFKRVTKMAGPDPFSLLHQGVCLMSLGRHQEALPLLENALDVCGDDEGKVQIYEELAFCYSTLRMPDKALAMLDKTDELPCDHLDMQVIKGHILLENNKIHEAEQEFRKAITESEAAPRILLRILVSLLDNHFLQACYRMFKLFLPVLIANDNNEGYPYMALCCHDLGKTDEFLHYLRLATKHTPHEASLVLGFLFPEDTPVSEYVAYMEQRQGNTK